MALPRQVEWTHLLCWHFDEDISNDSCHCLSISKRRHNSMCHFTSSTNDARTFFIIKALTISSFLPFFLCLLRRHLLLLTLCLMISQVSIEGCWLFLRIACLLIYTVKTCHQCWVYYSISMTLFHHSALIWKTYYINNSSKNFTRPRPFLISTLIRILCI